MRPSIGLAAAGLALSLAGCAVANTPQQNLAYDRWAKCQIPYVQIQGVDLDGRITFQYTGTTARDEVLQCLAGAGRSGPPLPNPVTTRPPGGP